MWFKYKEHGCACWGPWKKQYKKGKDMTEGRTVHCSEHVFSTHLMFSGSVFHTGNASSLCSDFHMRGFTGSACFILWHSSKKWSKKLEDDVAASRRRSFGSSCVILVLRMQKCGLQVETWESVSEIFSKRQYVTSACAPQGDGQCMQYVKFEKYW